MATKNSKNGNGKQTPPASIGRAEFLAKAKALVMVLDGHTHTAAVKEFSSKNADTGLTSYGWMVSDKQTVMVDGVPHKAQVSTNITLIGSNQVAN